MKKVINKLLLLIIMGVLVINNNVYAEEIITSGEVITSGDVVTSGDNQEEQEEIPTSKPEEEKPVEPELGETALLSNITISGIKNGENVDLDLNKKVSDSRFEYQTIAESGIDSVIIKVKTKDNAKVIESDCNLDTYTSVNTGENKFTIKVQSEDGKNENTYTITIIKATDNLKLKTLNIRGVQLNETFDPEENNYTLDIANNLQSIVIVAAAEDKDATVSTSGYTNLKVGRNTVKIVVKNQAGETNEYKITVTRAAEDEIVSSEIEDETITSDIELSDIEVSEDITIFPEDGNDKDNNSDKKTNDLTTIIVILICVILAIIAGIGIYFFVITGNSEKNRQRKIAKLKKKQAKIEEQLTGLMPVITEEQSSNYVQAKQPVKIEEDYEEETYEDNYDNFENDNYEETIDFELENTIEIDTKEIEEQVENKKQEEIKKESSPKNILEDFDDLFIDE